MILTIDTEKLTDHAAEHLARYFDARAAEALHLSGAVPEPHDRELDASAAKDQEIAAEIRAFVATRLAAYNARLNQAIHAARWKNCFDAFEKQSPTTRHLLRRAIARALVREGAPEVGSSDINHAIFARWERNDRDFCKCISELVNEESFELDPAAS